VPLGTTEEIWAQTEGRVTHLVAGIGTSGTLVGTAQVARRASRAAWWWRSFPTVRSAA
jgi:cystathionine beta-synthase